MRLLVLFFIGSSYMTAAQSVDFTDSLSHEFCQTLNEFGGEVDSSMVVAAWQKHLASYVTTMHPDAFDRLSGSVHIRLQRICKVYHVFVFNNFPNRGDWTISIDPPSMNLKKKDCRGILDFEKLSYLEPSGRSVEVVIRDGRWQDLFPDGTTTNLDFEWVDKCVFDITFVSSTNENRTNLSRPGDRYRYFIADKKQGYFEISTVSVGVDDLYYSFKMYVE